MEPKGRQQNKRGALLNILSTTLGKYGGFMAKINYFFPSSFSHQYHLKGIHHHNLHRQYHNDQLCYEHLLVCCLNKRTNQRVFGQFFLLHKRAPSKPLIRYLIRFSKLISSSRSDAQLFKLLFYSAELMLPISFTSGSLVTPNSDPAQSR